MPRISVFLPTHEHASTLPYAVRSVQAQGVDDLEILICGDGVGAELRAVIAELQRGDKRIRFFDLPKAPARGELNRDYVLRQAEGEIILHQNDDDLWLPGHIEVLERAIEDVDFVGAMQVDVGTDGRVRTYYFDLERPEFVEPWLQWKHNNLGAWACDGFGPIFVAHRRDAFLRLPEGWMTTPPGLPADQAMWHRFLRQPWCRAKFLRWPIALHFPALDRRDWSLDRRGEELRHWTQIIESPDYAVRIWRDIMPDLGDRLLCQSLEERKRRAETMQAHEEGTLARERTLQAETDALRRQVEAHQAAHELEQVLRAELEAEHAELQAEYAELKAGHAELQAGHAELEAEHAVLQAEHNAVLSSTCWRMTAPLRQAFDRIRRLGR
jgi:glycosyltransferase involved in cell wall biosynthesis